MTPTEYYRYKRIKYELMAKEMKGIDKNDKN